MKKILLVFVLLFSFALFCNAEKPFVLTEVSCKAAVLGTEKFFPVLLKEINTASESIYICMYYISYTSGQKGRVGQIIEALSEAVKRGVKVEVVLNRDSEKSGSEMNRKNIRAYSSLKKAGISVSYDEVSTLTHAKYFIMDEENIIIGSFNLSENALTSNREKAVLIRSKELARDCVDEFKTISKYNPEAVEGAIPIPVEFFRNKEIFSKMITRSSREVVEFSFYAFKKLYEQGGRTIRISMDEVERDLFNGKVPRSKAKKDPVQLYMHRFLKIWKKLYPEFIQSYRRDEKTKDLYVELGMENKATEDALYLSKIFWEDGWNARLSNIAKWALLYVLERTESGRMGRYFMEGKWDAAKEYHVGHTVVAYGTGELQRWNLIEKEINYRIGEDTPNGYILNDFYIYGDFEKSLQQLKRETDPKVFEVACGLTDSVDEVSDLKVYKRFIELGRKYGVSPLERILKKCHAEKNGASPLRRMAYVEQSVINAGEGR